MIKGFRAGFGDPARLFITTTPAAKPTDGFASEGDFCAINKHQPPRPPTLRYGATPLHMRGEFYLPGLPDQVGQ
ncbi:MAG: hypothetical protein LBB23_02075 [Rickettsiales bacterium]|nr:hypothetical protein [Rickettsiales bacterium]